MTGFRAILQHLKSENGKGKYQNMKNRKEFNLGGDKKICAFLLKCSLKVKQLALLVALLTTMVDENK